MSEYEDKVKKVYCNIICGLKYYKNGKCEAIFFKTDGKVCSEYNDLKTQIAEAEKRGEEKMWNKAIKIIDKKIERESRHHICADEKYYDLKEEFEKNKNCPLKNKGGK